MKTKKKTNHRSKTPGISRIDQEHKYNHGFYVRLTRNGKKFAKWFNDTKFGGKAKALLAAQKHYNQLLRGNKLALAS